MSEDTSKELQANFAWLKLYTVPTQLQFSEAASCLDRIVEVFPQLELEAASILNCTGSTTTLPATLYRVQLVNHLLDKVLEAGDMHARSLERRLLLVQADSLGRRVNSILKDLEAISEPFMSNDPALNTVNAAAARSTVETATVLGITGGSNNGLIVELDQLMDCIENRMMD